MNAKFGNRKAVRHNRSLYVNLPRIWITTIGVHEGDNLEVEMTKEGLLVKLCQN